MAVLQGGRDLRLSWLDGLPGGDLRQMGTQVGDIATEGMGELSAVVGEDLCVERAAREGDIGLAAVEQVFRAEFGVHMDEDALGGLALAGVAGHGVAVVEVWLRGRVDSVTDLRDSAQLAVGDLQIPRGGGERFRRSSCLMAV
jgi:hypothetical protein